MAREMVGSAVIGETVNRIISSLVGKLEQEKPDELTRDSIERLEMAHIRMEAALAVSSKWQITDVPMLRWRSKLKRAAQDCNDALRRSKQRAAEDDQDRQWVSQSSLPKRIAHATKSLVSYFINSDAPACSTLSDVQRFERFAGGANEFLKLVEFGGTPRQYMFFNPLIGHLLSGKSVRYSALKGSKFYILAINPMSFEDRGVEAKVWFSCQDSKAPTEHATLGFMLRLSESTDVFGVIIKCLQSCLCMPHFKSVAERVKGELVQLPTQDFSWVAVLPYGQGEYWTSVHNTLSQWHRPNPLCCSDHEHHPITSPSTSSNTNASSSSRSLSSMFPEQVISLLLCCHISLSDHHHNSNMPPLKLGAMFIPHDSPEDMEPAAESYALEVMGENEQEVVHSNACLQDIDDKLLPKALQYLYQNNGSRMYQMWFKSSHGSAHLCMEKASTETHNTRRRRSTARSRGPDKRRVEQDDNYGFKGWKPVIKDLLKFRVVHASNKLQGSIRSWIN